MNISLLCVSRVESVSYTHLDVYKRQVKDYGDYDDYSDDDYSDDDNSTNGDEDVYSQSDNDELC